ncbi:MAG: HPr family phosphocarrier protein [Eubacteriales bacterium]
MNSFEFVVRDELGIHARPAGMLVKAAKEYDSKITLTKGEKTVEATKLMAIMSMGIKQGETVTVAVEGGNEEATLAGMKAFFEENL